MTEDDVSFRINISFNKKEYADLYSDLSQYSRAIEQSGRIRYILRMGLQVLNGSAPTGGISLSNVPRNNSSIALDVTTQRDNAAPSAVSGLDAFMQRGFSAVSFDMQESE